MHESTQIYDFPGWLRIAHYINFLLMSFLVRSGIQILADHPRLYWNVDCKPNSEWIRFTNRAVPTDRLYTANDDESYASPWIALPGGKHTLGVARFWHFFCVMFWVLNGVIYVTLLFATDNWHRLIPTSWDVFPRALQTFFTYASFHLPAASEFRPYDPLQQLAYVSVIFVMAPLTILTGIGMSPVVVGHWPWYQKLFGNRQVSRSLHFILAVGWLIFFVIHVSLVILTGFSANMNRIVLGGMNGPNSLALGIGLTGIAFVILINALATWYSSKSPVSIQNTLGHFTDRLMKTMFRRLTSRQEYSQDAISPYFWVNGRPPETAVYQQLRDGSFADYRLIVEGLVEKPLTLSLDELKAMPRRTQITLQNCIQGWSGIAQWTGLPVSELLKDCKPLPEAKYVVFHSFEEDEEGLEFYGTLDLQDARSPQTILAYAMNGTALPIQYGAPLRLRVETKLGYKMTKYLKSIELIADYRTIGLGQGGYREDRQYFSTIAGI